MVPVPMDGVGLPVLLQLVDLLVIMLGVILLSSQLTKFLTVEYVGYQKGKPDAFYSFKHPAKSIDGPYVDGIFITYGIYTKEAPLDLCNWLFQTWSLEWLNIGTLPAPFVHENYYCESGTTSSPS